MQGIREATPPLECLLMVNSVIWAFEDIRSASLFPIYVAARRALVRECAFDLSMLLVLLSTALQVSLARRGPNRTAGLSCTVRSAPLETTLQVSLARRGCPS